MSTFFVLFSDVFSRYQIDIDDKNISVINSDDVISGETGIVIRDDKYIIDYAFTSLDKDEVKKVVFKRYTLFDKDFFESIDSVPKSGDKILFGYLNSRAMIVCNSRKDLIQIEKDYDQIKFIHPDMLASYLAVEYDPSPALDDFMATATDFYLGLYFFCLPKKNKIAIVDSLTLNVLELIDYTPLDISEKQLPFYTRVENIETSIFNFDDDRVVDYSKYYNKLLKIK
jgi:hypothetical protein